MPTSSSSPSPAGTPPLSLEEVRTLARLLHEADLSEIEIETVAPAAPTASATSPGTPTETPPQPVVRLQLRRGTEPSVVRRVATALRAAPTAVGKSPSAPASTSSDATADSGSGVELLSPGVGIFRAAKPALQAGDEVKAGQKAGAVEALKIPTDIVFAQAGRISTVFVEDGNGIEYAQPLFLIEPLD
jgi:acetyl-CoA carboxylase biotin carboxyl carrier protein